MPGYYIYCIGSDNRIVSRHDCEAPSDLAALAHAKEICGPHEVEVWQQSRLVARLAKDGTSLQPDSEPHFTATRRAVRPQ